MEQLDSVIDIQRRAAKLRKATTSEASIYLHAIHDYMMEQRKILSPERADYLERFLLRKFEIE